MNYKDKILFIEIPEGQDMKHGEPIVYVKNQLYDLRNAGVFNKIKGLIIGRAFRYSDENRQKLEGLIRIMFRDCKFPIISDFDVGHTDPKITIPIGVNVSMDSQKNSIAFDKAGVEQN